MAKQPRKPNIPPGLARNKIRSAIIASRTHPSRPLARPTPGSGKLSCQIAPPKLSKAEVDSSNRSIALPRGFLPGLPGERPMGKT
jgi:hypothetical protein